MKSIINRWLLVGMLLATLGFGLFQSTPVSATDPTTSLHIVKLATDGVSVLAETTISYQTLKDTLPVQGNGTTHYYTQGPSFDDANWWDPAETANLKDKGALQGTDLKDLCELVGGMQAGDTVRVQAADGYGNDRFPYSNVYNPDPQQGKMVVCWYNGAPEEGSPGYVPTFTMGMLLAFFTSVPSAEGKLVFGNQDMRECLPENIWHWNSGFPSVNGLYNKWVSNITIYTGATPDWSLQLNGARNQEIPRAEFENGQGASCHGSTKYTDGAGTWSGLPLWMLIAFVDDTTVLHGEGSFNDILAAASYDVKVIGADGSYTFSSSQIARHNDIILANKLNNSELPSSSYPLKVVGSGLTEAAQSIGRVIRIELHNIPNIAQWTLPISGMTDYTFTQTLFEQGIQCHGPAGQPWTYNDGSNIWSGIPLWYFCGWVDDANQHGNGSYNDNLADLGYSIKVYGANGSLTVLNSHDIRRSSQYLLANQRNGQVFTDAQYPLVLVGSGLPSASRIVAVSRIELVLAKNWDLNGDHTCDIGDVVMVGQKWGQSGQAGWIPEDLNQDGVIDSGDMVVLGLHWNETW
jgi:hypothetical protein